MDFDSENIQYFNAYFFYTEFEMRILICIILFSFVLCLKRFIQCIQGSKGTIYFLLSPWRYE